MARSRRRDEQGDAEPASSPSKVSKMTWLRSITLRQSSQQAHFGQAQRDSSAVEENEDDNDEWLRACGRLSPSPVASGKEDRYWQEDLEGTLLSSKRRRRQEQFEGKLEEHQQQVRLTAHKGRLSQIVAIAVADSGRKVGPVAELQKGESRGALRLPNLVQTTGALEADQRDWEPAAGCWRRRREEGREAFNSISSQVKKERERRKQRRDKSSKKMAPRRPSTAARLRGPHEQQVLLNWILVLGLALLPLPISLTAGAASEQQYIKGQPEAQYLVANGQDVRLGCLVHNRQGECTWVRNGQVVGPIARKYHFQRQPEDGDCGLLIRNASVQFDDGLWQCQVLAPDVDQQTLQSLQAKVVVLVPPEAPEIQDLVS